MRVVFRKARLPAELDALMAFDRKVFSPADLFPRTTWTEFESYWMIVDGVKAGCCAFAARRRTLYVSSTGILPEYRGRGLGALLKFWEISYARFHGYKRVAGHTRSRNKAMIALNRKFKFRVIRITPGYYQDPEDAAVFMELVLST